MIKDKITALIKKEDKPNKKKIENLIFALILLVITLVSINIIFKDDKKEKIETDSKIENSKVENNINNDIEKKLEEILIQIKGVEKVKVLVTYSETEKVVPIYNEKSSQSTTEESDKEGGKRKIESYDTDKEVISDSSQVPITEKVILPKIEGAIITAKGAENLKVKENIINAVEAATGLSTHEIQVFEMK